MRALLLAVLVAAVGCADSGGDPCRHGRLPLGVAIGQSGSCYQEQFSLRLTRPTRLEVAGFNPSGADVGWCVVGIPSLIAKIPLWGVDAEGFFDLPAGKYEITVQWRDEFPGGILIFSLTTP